MLLVLVSVEFSNDWKKPVNEGETLYYLVCSICTMFLMHSSTVLKFRSWQMDQMKVRSNHQVERCIIAQAYSLDSSQEL